MRSAVERILLAAVLLSGMLWISKVAYVRVQEVQLHNFPKQTLANPASVNCTKKGGTLELKTRGDGGVYGVCIFEDAMECEEWALFRGDCPAQGVRITGYDTKAQIYCAISGGQTLAVQNATCTLPNGAVCSVDEYYNGTCE